MMRVVAMAGLLGLGLGLAALSASARGFGRAGAEEKPLAHMVFFTLKDKSAEGRAKFVASCRELLSKHDGTVYFSVGEMAEDVVEPVSVRDFDVALHVVFANKGARDKYLAHPRHDKFVETNKAQFEKVRVFDSYLSE
jgi:hypothetical protein